MGLFPKFILFGDSITQYASSQDGFALAPALQHLYSRKADIVTRGFLGYNSEWARPVFAECLRADAQPEDKVKLVLIFLGTNDAGHTFQAVPVDRYADNLRYMVDLAQAKGIKVVLVGPGLHHRIESLIESGDRTDFSSSKRTRLYADAAQAVALEKKVPFVDLWAAFQKHGGWSTEDLLNDLPDLLGLLPDGIHFSPEAYEVFYDAWVETVAALYPELTPALMPLVLPDYSEIDPDNVLALLGLEGEA